MTLTVTMGRRTGRRRRPSPSFRRPSRRSGSSRAWPTLQGSIQGTLWQTDVTDLQPRPSRPAAYSLAFLDGDHPVDPAPTSTGSRSISARSRASRRRTSWPSSDSRSAAYGALLVRGDVRRCRPSSRRAPSTSATPEGHVRAVRSDHATLQRADAPGRAPQQLLIGLRDDATAYTNIGLMNLSTDWSHARLTFLDRSGATTFGQVNVDVRRTASRSSRARSPRPRRTAWVRGSARHVQRQGVGALGRLGLPVRHASSTGGRRTPSS